MKYDLIKSRMESLKDPIRAKTMAQYMRNQFEFYGIMAEDRRKTYKDVVLEDKNNNKIDWDLLYISAEDDYREMSYFVNDYLSELESVLKFEDLDHLKQLAQIDPWWDTIDMISRQVGHTIRLDPKGSEEILKWSLDKNMWIRRVAIIHQLKMKEKTDTELLKKIVISNLGSSEFFINKAIGWALREYSKTNPQWVESMITDYKDELSKLSIREGSKYI